MPCPGTGLALSADPPTSQLTPREKRPSACPECGCGHITKFGFYRWQDGTRRQRYQCHGCGITFCAHTGTPLHYIKKRAEWHQQAEGLGLGLSVRKMARALKVTPATAFRWRHGVIRQLRLRPRAALGSSVAVTEAYVPYSEKGSRTTDGPGARCRIPLRRYRRFIDGKPSRVLLLSNDRQQAAVVVDRGQPTVAAIQASLASLVKPGAELRALGHVQLTDACRRLRATFQHGWHQSVARVQWLHRHLHNWLRRFHGVATKYLERYLVWHSRVFRAGARRPVRVGRRMLELASLPAPAGQRAG